MSAAETPRPPAPTVRRATRRDLEVVGRTLGEAFEGDPVFTWLIQREGKPVERIGHFMIATADVHLRNDSVWMTSDGSAAAIWAPPGKYRITTRQFLRRGWRAMVGAGWAAWPRSGALTVTERHHPDEPHWYLAVLGTRPDHQGQGLATALVAPVLQWCDDEGIGAYLETMKEENLPFYERLGFTVRETFRIPKGGPDVWTMWRDPQPPDDR